MVCIGHYLTEFAHGKLLTLLDVCKMSAAVVQWMKAPATYTLVPQVVIVIPDIGCTCGSCPPLAHANVKYINGAQKPFNILPQLQCYCRQWHQVGLIWLALEADFAASTVDPIPHVHADHVLVTVHVVASSSPMSTSLLKMATASLCSWGAGGIEACSIFSCPCCRLY